MTLSKFEVVILTVMGAEDHGMWQRLDGLQCEPSIREKEWWFFHFQLWRMVRKGLLEKTYFNHSVFRWSNALPFYRITAAGQKAIEEHEL